MTARNATDEIYQNACPCAPPPIVTQAITTTWATPTLTIPPSCSRYRLQIAPLNVDYEIRFGSETDGFKVPAGTMYETEWLGKTAAPSMRTLAGSATLVMFVYYPDL